MLELACKLSLNLRMLVNQIKALGTALLPVILLCMLGGCQLLADSRSNKTDFSHYYLWVKSLNDEEVAQEIIKQKENKESGQVQADMQLIMLYSLPNSPIHNPYTAKTLLNQYHLASNNETVFSATDLVFIVMLKDQLNQQLLLLEKITNYKGVYQHSKKVNATQQLKINKLNSQIIQLKKIEKTLSQRGQQ